MQTLTRTTDRVLVEVNDAFLRTLGFTRAEVLGKATLDLNIWVFPEKAVPFRDRLNELGVVRDYEVELRTKSGEVLTVLLSADMVDIDGEPHVVAAGVDITARKRAEAELRVANERLRESEARWSTVFRASPAAVSLGRLDDGKLVAVNEAFHRATGFTEAEALGRNSRELGLYAQPEARDAFFHQVTTLGCVRDYEYLLRSKDGTLRTMILSAEIVDVDGAPHVLAVASDITARKEAEEKLRESERRLRETEARFSAAFHSSPILMTVARLEDGKFVEINAAFARLIGRDRPRILGRDSKDLGLWVDLDARAAFFQALREHRVVRNVESLIRDHQGRVRTMQISGEIIEINREPHLITFALDVTQDKLAEAELQRSLEQERELSQLKSDFVSLVSHEFRTPLEIIMSSTDNLQRYHDRLAPEKREQLLTTIHKSVRRMATMMEEVLVLGRLETDSITFKPARFDLRAFCQRVCEEIEAATAKSCPVRLHAQGPVDEASGDENMLRHIFTNLLSNAVKYSHPGQAVEFLVERDGVEAVLQVVDHGCGIPEADQKRLFQAFHRGSNVRQIPGTGLGPADRSALR